MLESHMKALPPQRWLGRGYEADAEVWKPEIMAGETQYWLGSSLLVGGVYEPGKDKARIYLPRSSDADQGYINLNAPHQHLQAGQWVDIHSYWKESIPLLAKVGGALIIGKDVQTRSPGDTRFPSPNAVEDDYRAVEIFPPLGSSGVTYENVWYEDDGVSAMPEILKFTMEYRSTETEVLVTCAREKGTKYEPVWKELDIILPVGDERVVALENGKGASEKEMSRGRKVWCLAL